MNFSFGDILTRAWQITWKYRALWLFGLLASCGTSGGFNIGGASNFNSNNQSSSSWKPPQFMQDLMHKLTPENIVRFAVIAFVVLLVLSFILTAISVIGRIGLIRGTMQGAKSEAPVIGELFSAGWPYFWRSFWMWLVIGIPSLFIFLAILIGFLAGILAFFAAVTVEQQSARLVSFVPVLALCACFTGLFGIVLGWVGQQAQTALVLEDLSILAAVQRGWQVVRTNLASIIFMSVALGLIHWFATLLISLPLMAILIPVLIAFIFSASGSGGAVSFAPLTIAGIAMLCYLPISLTANGILTAFTQSSWTLTYVELTRQPESPVIENNVQA